MVREQEREQAHRQALVVVLLGWELLESAVAGQLHLVWLVSLLSFALQAMLALIE